MFQSKCLLNHWSRRCSCGSKSSLGERPTIPRGVPLAHGVSARLLFTLELLPRMMNRHHQCWWKVCKQLMCEYSVDVRIFYGLLAHSCGTAPSFVGPRLIYYASRTVTCCYCDLAWRPLINILRSVDGVLKMNFTTARSDVALSVFVLVKILHELYGSRVATIYRLICLYFRLGNQPKYGFT